MNNNRILSRGLTAPAALTLHRVNVLTHYRLFIGLVIAIAAIASHAADLKTEKMSMQPQKNFFKEQCFTLERGQGLSYQVSTTHPINFNLHHHPENGPTVFPDRLLLKSRHSKQIVAEASGEYCFMATNPADQPAAFDVVISYEITAQ